MFGLLHSLGSFSAFVLSLVVHLVLIVGLFIVELLQVGLVLAVLFEGHGWRNDLLDTWQSGINFWVLEFVVLIEGALGAIRLLAALDDALIVSFDFVCGPSEPFVLLVVAIVGAESIVVLGYKGTTSSLWRRERIVFFSSIRSFTWFVSTTLARYRRQYSW